jgi:hypothetical protein
MISRSKYPTSRQLTMAGEKTEVGSLLPPSSGPTQAGATPELMFRVRLDPGAATTVQVIASRNEAADGSKEVELER